MIYKIGLPGKGLVTQDEIKEYSKGKTADAFVSGLRPSVCSGVQVATPGKVRVQALGETYAAFIAMVIPSFILMWDDTNLYILDRVKGDGDVIYKYTKHDGGFLATSTEVPQKLREKMLELNGDAAVAKNILVTKTHQILTTLRNEIAVVSDRVSRIECNMSMLYMIVFLIVAWVVFLNINVKGVEVVARDAMLYATNAHVRVDILNTTMSLRALDNERELLRLKEEYERNLRRVEEANKRRDEENERKIAEHERQISEQGNKLEEERMHIQEMQDELERIKKEKTAIAKRNSTIETSHTTPVDNPLVDTSKALSLHTPKEGSFFWEILWTIVATIIMLVVLIFIWDHFTV